jgi:hypothetical protein
VANDNATKGVSWMLAGSGCSGATCGTLSANSSASGAVLTYTAPAVVPSPANVTLSATSVAGGTKSATATITITAAPAIVVVVSPTTASVAAGGATASFTATVQNDSQISSLTLTATSVADSTKSAAAAITITGSTKVAVTVTPATSNIVTGAVTQTFTASVQNDSQNKAVAWTLSGANCKGATCGAVSPASTLSGAMVTYTSPASAVNPGTIVLTATSVADNTASAAATITLSTPPAPTPSSPLNLGEASVPEGFGEPVIATLSAGNIDVAWINQPGPEFVRSTNGGTTISAPLIIPSNMQDTVEGNNVQMGVDGTATSTSYGIALALQRVARFSS